MVKASWRNEVTTKVIRLISGAAAAILLALVLVLATRDIDNGLGANSPLVGQLVPAIVGTDFAGRTFDVDEHKNSGVLVNFLPLGAFLAFANTQN